MKIEWKFQSIKHTKEVSFSFTIHMYICIYTGGLLIFNTYQFFPVHFKICPAHTSSLLIWFKFWSVNLINYIYCREGNWHDNSLFPLLIFFLFFWMNTIKKKIIRIFFWLFVWILNLVRRTRKKKKKWNRTKFFLVSYQIHHKLSISFSSS